MAFIRKDKGFSLVEIMITISVLSILITTSFLIIPSLINKANDARRKADLQKIKIYLESYYNDAKQYPRILPDCSQPFMYKDSTILQSFPCDPVSKEPYYYQIKGGEPQSYRVYALLENTQDISISNLGCLGGCGPDCSYNYGVSSTNVGLVRCSYVCAPGGGKTGSCELFNDPSISLCPKEYYKDSTCNNECAVSKNRCKNASGKHIPY